MTDTVQMQVQWTNKLSLNQIKIYIYSLNIEISKQVFIDSLVYI